MAQLRPRFSQFTPVLELNGFIGVGDLRRSAEMNRSEAKNVLSKALERYGALSWSELSEAVDQNRIDDFEAYGDSGISYQIEINFAWDDTSKKTIRVLGMIDDGGLSAFFPQGKDILVTDPQFREDAKK